MWHHSCHTTIAMSTNSAFLFVGKKKWENQECALKIILKHSA